MQLGHIRGEPEQAPNAREKYSKFAVHMYVCVYVYVCMQRYVVHMFIVCAQYASTLHHRDPQINAHALADTVC